MITVPELAAEALGVTSANYGSPGWLNGYGARRARPVGGEASRSTASATATRSTHRRAHDAGDARRLRHLPREKASDRHKCERLCARLVACLFHDIGYVRGILNGDSDDGFIVDAKGGMARLQRGSSDAALFPIASTARSCS